MSVRREYSRIEVVQPYLFLFAVGSREAIPAASPLLSRGSWSCCVLSGTVFSSHLFAPQWVSQESYHVLPKNGPGTIWINLKEISVEMRRWAHSTGGFLSAMVGGWSPVQKSRFPSSVLLFHASSKVLSSPLICELVAMFPEQVSEALSLSKRKRAINASFSNFCIMWVQCCHQIKCTIEFIYYSW